MIKQIKINQTAKNIVKNIVENYKKPKPKPEPKIVINPLLRREKTLLETIYEKNKEKKQRGDKRNLFNGKVKKIIRTDKVMITKILQKDFTLTPTLLSYNKRKTRLFIENYLEANKKELFRNRFVFKFGQSQITCFDTIYENNKFGALFKLEKTGLYFLINLDNPFDLRTFNEKLNYLVAFNEKDILEDGDVDFENIIQLI